MLSCWHHKLHHLKLASEGCLTQTELIVLQELASSKDQPALRTNKDAFEPHIDVVPPAALAAAFERSDIFQKTRGELDEPYDREASHSGSLMKAKYGVPGWDMVKALWWRERCNTAPSLVFGAVLAVCTMLALDGVANAAVHASECCTVYPPF